MPDSLHDARRTRLLERELSYFDDRAKGLASVLADGVPATLEQVRLWHPDWADADDEALRAAAIAGRFTLDDARLVYAREHGFESWQALAAHLRRLAAGEVREPFVEILDVGRAGDWRQVNALLREHPDLVRARGTNGNTLLNLASSLVCGPAQASDDRSPGRLDPIRLLLAAGADIDAPNDRGWTALHQAGYSNDVELASLLLAAGARPDLEAHGSGGTPLAVALFWGHREATARLAEEALAPRNLRIASALGDAGLVRACFDDAGRPTVAACAGRGFYRPHSGFPAWRQAGEPQEVLDEALTWAARSGRTEAMPLLIERGAHIDADPYRGTPLIWAAWAGRVDAVRWLLDHGADPNRRATFGGLSHGQGVTAIHLAAQNDRVAVIELLLERGADPSIEDALYGGPALGWARHGGARRAVELLERRMTGTGD